MRRAADRRQAVQHRRPDGTVEVGPTWESLVERQIREAMEDGKFDRLPFQGEPLPNDDNPYAGEWGLAYHMLRNAGAAPPWIEADREVRGLLEELRATIARAAGDAPLAGSARGRGRARVADLVGRANAGIARLNAEAPTTAQHRRPLVLADELARFDEACGRG